MKLESMYVVATVNNGKREGDNFVHTFDVNGIRPVSEITLTLATDFYTENTFILEANIEAGGFNNYNPIVWTVKNTGTTDAVITEGMS